ncbi:MAG: carbonic anhydrase [Burkholderiaceae bacterium]
MQNQAKRPFVRPLAAMLALTLAGGLFSASAVSAGAPPAAPAAPHSAVAPVAAPAMPKAAPVAPAAAPAPAAGPVAVPAGDPNEAIRKAIAERIAGKGEVVLKSTGVAPASQTKKRAAPKKHTVHWSYEGEGGPHNWGKISKQYLACANGKNQSPIAVEADSMLNLDLPAIDFDYRDSRFSIVDNGHTVEVKYLEGGAMTILGQRYELVQFHFHRPAEEVVNGKRYDMVAHLVHKNSKGQLAVVAVLLTLGEENRFIQTLWNHMPIEKKKPIEPPTAKVDLAKFLPANKAYFHYMGSLTTPPCTEGVAWYILQSPVEVSAGQVEVFSKMYANNARPTQRMNGRLVKASRAPADGMASKPAPAMTAMPRIPRAGGQ